MPTWLIILLGIFLFFLILLSINVGIIVDYKDKPFVYLKIFFIKIRLYPSKKKEKRKKQHKHKKEKKKHEEKKDEDKKATPSKKKSKFSVPAPKALFEMSQTVLALIKKCFGFLHFKFIRLKIIISEEDAAKTALLYGATSQGISYLLEILNNISNVEIKKCSDISLSTDFINQSPYFDGKIYLYIRVINVIKIAFLALKAFLKFSKYKNK